MFHVNSTYMCNEFEVHVYKTQPSVLKERYTHAFTSFPYLYKIPKIKKFTEFITYNSGYVCFPSRCRCFVYNHWF